ncbi:MAG TPA: hypothetical protein VMW92_08155 [Candidatus Heimdallarchaeota archaeon]|nr:hypothetical protein [Candidatus Heimdallarchaeota archaeon]
MRMNKRILLAIFLLLLPTLFALAASKALQETDVADVVDKTAKRLESYPEMSHWQALVLSKKTEMDKNWKPKKETVVQKTLLMKDKIQQEKIQSAVEIEKGKSKDVTQEYINQAYKDMQKAAREKKKTKDKDGEEEQRRRMDLSLDEMFPFSEKNRENYDFTLLQETTLEGIPVYVLDAKAKQRTKEFFDGIFYIDKETWDIRRAELQLAKNPGPLKLMEMGMDFYVLPEGYFALRKISVRIHVGFVVKNIRQEVVDEYSDYQILEQKGSIPKSVMNDFSSAPISDFENTLSFPSEETSLGFGYAYEQLSLYVL